MRLLCVAVGLGVAAPALAGDFMRLDIELSSDAQHWGHDLVVAPGTPVSVRFNITFARDAGYINWSSCALTQLNVAGSDAADAASGFSGRLLPSNSAFALSDAGTQAAKIDRLDAPAANILMAQPVLSNGGVADNPIVTFRITYTPSANPARRDIVLDAPDAFLVSGSLFTNAQGTEEIIPPTARSLVGATIHVAPAPASLALFVVCIPRRRRT